MLLLLLACEGDVDVITPPAPDDDGDGFDNTVDCDDADPDSWPGAPEVPDDDVDQDCDGLDARTLFGNADDPDSITTTSGYLQGSPVSVTNPLALTHLGLVVRYADGTLRLALYEDDDGVPGALVVQTDALTPEIGDTEGAVQATLEPGDYWMMLSNSAAIDVGAGTDEPLAFINHDADQPLPDPFPAATVVDSPRLGLYLVGDLP